MLSVRSNPGPSRPVRVARRPWAHTTVARFAALAVALTLLAGALGACASDKAAKAAPGGGTATFVVPASGTTLRIVSDAWVASQGYEGETVADRRTDYYRKNVYKAAGQGPAVKVCDDAVFGGIVEALEQAGFGRNAAPGPAPTEAAAGQALELTQAGDARHFTRTKGMPAEAAKDFATCLSVFGEVFNAIDGYQSGDGNFEFREKR